MPAHDTPTTLTADVVSYRRVAGAPMGLEQRELWALGSALTTTTFPLVAHGKVLSLSFFIGLCKRAERGPGLCGASAGCEPCSWTLFGGDAAPESIHQGHNVLR